LETESPGEREVRRGGMQNKKKTNKYASVWDVGRTHLLLCRCIGALDHTHRKPFPDAENK
jgi:hypothetical protein